MFFFKPFLFLSLFLFFWKVFLFLSYFPISLYSNLFLSFQRSTSGFLLFLSPSVIFYSCMTTLSYDENGREKSISYSYLQILMGTIHLPGTNLQNENGVFLVCTDLISKLTHIKRYACFLGCIGQKFFHLSTVSSQAKT